MTLIHSIVLGIVQGVAEFLPISSSAHLVIIPWILGWDDGGLTFDIALHAGTLIALLVYFWREWIMMLKALIFGDPQAPRLDRSSPPTSDAALAEGINRSLAISIIAATIPGAIMGLLLEKKAEHAFRDPGLIAINLAIVGVALWVFDRRGFKAKNLKQMTLRDALVIGVAQGFAVIPGVSRAGITISAALLLGYERATAARFSFFLSMPIIAGACILKLRHLGMADLTPSFLAGIAAAAIAGYLVIGGLIRFLQNRSYGAFAVYRVAAAAVVWSIIAFRH